MAVENSCQNSLYSFKMRITNPVLDWVICPILKSLNAVDFPFDARFASYLLHPYHSTNQELCQSVHLIYTLYTLSKMRRLISRNILSVRVGII